MHRFAKCLPFVILALAASLPAGAQDFPSRPITVIVPYAPGGSTDVLGRTLAETMSKELKTLVNDFEPIGLVADVPMILVAKKNLPPKNLEELIAYVKSQKDKVAFAHAGNGSTTHLCSVLLTSTLQTEMTLVPHREAGLPGFEIEVWHGLYAPKGTPAAVVERLVEALQIALRDPALVQRFASLGTAPVDQNRINPRALRAHVNAEVERWGPILRKAGVNAV